MSTPAHHNDDLFRQRLEDFREMPSETVWNGIETALNRNEKKRRLILWFWLLGSAAPLTAVLVWVSVLLAPSEHTSSFYTARNVAYTTVPLPVAGHQNTVRSSSKAAVSFPVPPVNPASNPSETTVKSTRNFKNTASTPGNGAKHNPVFAQIPPANRTVRGSDDILLPAAGSMPNVFSPSIRDSLLPVVIDIQDKQALTNLTPQIESMPPMPCIFVPPIPRLAVTLTVQGYGGGVAYHRPPKAPVPADPTSELNNGAIKTDSSPKTFGVYAGTTLKIGLVYNRHWYFNAGIGYETHYFADRYRFQIPGSPFNGLNSGVQGSTAVSEIPAYTSFGDALIPVSVNDQTDSQSEAVDLNGKLVYRLQQLIFPVDIGYRYNYKRFGVYVGAAAAFHVPVRQKAVFYADSGPDREVQLTATAPFNFSLGLEPGLEYNIAKRFTLLAGGTFRYQLLNAYKSTGVSRPYVLAGHLGMRITL